MKSFGQKIKNHLKENYPFLVILGIVFIIYIPYLSGKFITIGPSSFRFEIWDFILGNNFGWINFFKNMGEFMGGITQFGYFNPFQIIFRIVNFTDSHLAEYLLGIIYALIAFTGFYYLLRKRFFMKWVALLGATIFTLNGRTFTRDITTSDGFSGIMLFPFLFLIADQEFKGIWRKILFGILLGLESLIVHPQYIGWQLIIITIYIIYTKGWKIIKPFFFSLIIGGVLMFPQIFLTGITFANYDLQKIITEPFASSLPGNPYLFALQLINPFTPTTQYGYLTPYYYTALIATLIFLFFLPTLFRQWKTLPRLIKLSLVFSIFFFFASFQGSILQDYFLAKIPFFNIVISRNPYRYVYIYFFFLSFIVSYCLQTYLTNRERLIKFSKFILIVGILGTLGYVISSIIYKIKGEVIYEFLKERFINTRLPNVRGGYPTEYYFNLLRMYFDSYFIKNTLLSWSGFFCALPFVSFIIWSIAVLKEKIKQPIKYLPHLIVIQVIFTGLIFSAVLMQDARKLTPAVFDKKENNIAITIKEKPDWRNSYIISYGNFAGEIYFSNLYKDSYEINKWLAVNQYSRFINYDSVPRTQNDVNPFQLFRDRLLSTYIGYQLVDLFPLKGRFPNNEKSDPLILNDFAFDKDILNPTKMEKGLNDKINILRNIGVRFIVSQYEFKGPGFKLAQKVTFDKPSDLLPNYTANLYLYELNKPGKIIFAPEKIKLQQFDSIDLLDFRKVRSIYDDLNKNNISLIEIKNSTTTDNDMITQKISPEEIVFEKMEKDTISFKTNFKKDTFVIINTYYYPGWEALIDGVSTKINRANLNFLSIKIPKDKHQIILRFNIFKMIENS